MFRDILKYYDPDFESMGLDEANLDLTDFLIEHNMILLEEEEKINYEKIFLLCNQIRQKIFDQTKLTVSCGIGANKIIAKMASEENKPNG